MVHSLHKYLKLISFDFFSNFNVSFFYLYDLLMLEKFDVS